MLWGLESFKEPLMMRFVSRFSLLTVLAILALAPLARAESPVYNLDIKDHTFTPETLTVPANTPWILVIKNHDKTPEEFESEELSREKIIPGGGNVRITMGALKPGTYSFVGEFNPDKAKGQIVAQ
jgi:hypothetical protein